MDEETSYTDDLMPNDGAYFQPSEDTEPDTSEAEERAMVLTSYPVFQELLEWFDNSIAGMDSIDGLDPESSVPLASQVIARQTLKLLLTNKRSELETMRDIHVKR